MDNTNETVDSVIPPPPPSMELRIGSGDCASTALMDAIVTRYLLLERRRCNTLNKMMQASLDEYYDAFQQDLSLQVSQRRFVHACKLFTQVQRAWPRYRDEDTTICDSVHGLWCVGKQTKGLPNTMLQFLLAGSPPVSDPTAPLYQTVGQWLWYYVRRVGNFLVLCIFMYTFGLVCLMGSGSILITGAVRGAANWNEMVATMQSSTSSADTVEFTGWVSDRIQPLHKSTWYGKCLGCIYGQDHGAGTMVTYMEHDGADFTRKFVQAPRFHSNGLEHVLWVPMKRLSTQWSHAFPSVAFSKKHGILSRVGCATLGVFMWVYCYTLFPFLWETVAWAAAFCLLQAYFFWISWTCSPPEQPWEGIQLALWSPRGCHDYFSTFARVLVFRAWATSLPEQDTDVPQQSPSGKGSIAATSQFLSPDPSRIV